MSSGMRPSFLLSGVRPFVCSICFRMLRTSVMGSEVRKRAARFRNGCGFSIFSGTVSTIPPHSISGKDVAGHLPHSSGAEAHPGWNPCKAGRYARLLCHTWAEWFLQNTKYSPTTMKGMLRICPMSIGSAFSKSTCLSFRNSTKKRKVKIRVMHKPK